MYWDRCCKECPKQTLNKHHDYIFIICFLPPMTEPCNLLSTNGIVTYCSIWRLNAECIPCRRCGKTPASRYYTSTRKLLCATCELVVIDEDGFEACIKCSKNQTKVFHVVKETNTIKNTRSANFK